METMLPNERSSLQYYSKPWFSNYLMGKSHSENKMNRTLLYIMAMIAILGAAVARDMQSEHLSFAPRILLTDRSGCFVLSI
jgi:hypothetical protein